MALEVEVARNTAVSVEAACAPSKPGSLSSGRAGRRAQDVIAVRTAALIRPARILGRPGLPVVLVAVTQLRGAVAVVLI